MSKGVKQEKRAIWKERKKHGQRVDNGKKRSGDCDVI